MFTTNELDLLVEVLEEYQRDLHAEILDTDDREFRKDLKAKEGTIKNIIEKLEYERVAEVR